MIARSLPHLYALHVVAVDVLDRSGATCPLRFPTDLREVHMLAMQATVEIACALSVASRAGVFIQVEKVVRPAKTALAALIKGIREEQANISRDEHAGL